MLPRVIAAAAGLPVLLVAVWFGTPWLTLLVAAAAILGIREFYRLFNTDDVSLPLVSGSLWALAFIAAQRLSGTPAAFLAASGGVVIAGCLAGALWIIGSYRGRFPLQALVFLVLGPLAVGFSLAHALALRELGASDALGRGWLLLAMLVTFASDTGAFFVGRTTGRHPMAPVISPNKTWEGAAGGFLAAVLAAVVLATFFGLPIPLWQRFLAGAGIGIAAQAGDLAESKLKRISQVKDAGSIIPGHGGILDRLDSLSLSIPAAFYIAWFTAASGSGN